MRFNKRNWHFMRLTIKSTWYEEFTIKTEKHYQHTLINRDLPFTPSAFIYFIMHEIYKFEIKMCHCQLAADYCNYKVKKKECKWLTFLCRHSSVPWGTCIVMSDSCFSLVAYRLDLFAQIGSSMLPTNANILYLILKNIKRWT